jgi:hypothetical protein
MNAMPRNSAMKSRREILLNCARGGAMLALGGVAVRLGSRSFDGTCVRSNPCGACPLFTGCELPKANENRPPAPAPPIKPTAS